MATEDVEERLRALLAQTRGLDLFAAIERIAAEPDPEQAVGLFARLARRYYFEDKDVGRAVAIGRAGIQYCLCRAGDEALRRALRDKAKSLAFNTAANAWPGWGDKGVTHTPSDLAAGLDAARLNLRLVRELDKGPLAESKGHWIVGAQLLASGDLEGARRAFETARDLAQRAADGDHAQMNSGYAALVGVLRGDERARSRFDQVVEALRGGSKDAGFFADQLLKALEVFRARRA